MSRDLSQQRVQVPEWLLSFATFFTPYSNTVVLKTYCNKFLIFLQPIKSHFKTSVMADDSECSLTLERCNTDRPLHVSPHRNKKGQWELDLMRPGLRQRFPMEVTLPPFRHLQALMISTQGIRTIPEDIKNLENLAGLWLGYGDLEGFPMAVCELKKLVELHIIQNEKIKEISPRACAKMKGLRELYMQSCGLTCLPENLDQMVNLEVLHLSDNSLSHLCGALRNMTKLRYVWLEHNPFDCLEDEFPFDTLVNVEHLFFCRTNLHSLPGEIGQLPKIISIDLRFNELERLPKMICNLSDDTIIKLEGNPLSLPPKDVCESGMSSIKSYFQFLEGDITVMRAKRAKMIIVGESQSGKSSLLRAMEQLSNKIIQDACVKEEDRTIGIAQQTVRFGEMDVVVLDSGGQRSYSPISQLFTSNNCLVIVTADAQQYTLSGELAFKRLIQPYIQRIYDYVKVAVVLPVITKADLVTADNVDRVDTDLGQKMFEFAKEREKIVDLHRQQNSDMSIERQKITVIAKKYSYISEEEYYKKCLSKIVFTSAKTAIGTFQLFLHVTELLMSRSLFPELDILLSSLWVKAEDQLLSLAESHFPPICSLPASHNAITSCGVSEKDVQGLLSYLHSVGSISHYYQHSSLRQHIFLRPLFLIDVLKAIYHHQLKSVYTVDSIPSSQRYLVPQRELNKMLTNLNENGVASVKLLRVIWSRFGFKEEHINIMIKLLVSFNFAYVRCDNEHVIKTVNCLVDGINTDAGCDDLLSLLKEYNGELLLPWFFRNDKPEGLLAMCPSAKSVSVNLIYAFAMSLPEGLFERLSARCHRHSNSTHHWLNGVHIKYAAITALLQRDEERAELVLSATTVDSLNAYARLWHVAWRLIGDIENEIKQAPGTIHVVQRYISAGQEDIRSLVLGARRVDVPLFEGHPAFQINKEDPIVWQLDRHKRSVTNAQQYVHRPLVNILSPESGRGVTELDAKDIAIRIDDEKVLSKLRVTLGVKEADIVDSSDVYDKALAVINEWRQFSTQACVCVLRDALHKVGLQMVDESVFGHIQDQTLANPAAEAPGLSLSRTSDLKVKGSSPGEAMR